MSLVNLPGTAIAALRRFLGPADRVRLGAASSLPRDPTFGGPMTPLLSVAEMRRDLLPDPRDSAIVAAVLDDLSAWIESVRARYDSRARRPVTWRARYRAIGSSFRARFSGGAFAYRPRRGRRLVLDLSGVDGFSDSSNESSNDDADDGAMISLSVSLLPGVYARVVMSPGAASLGVVEVGVHSGRASVVSPGPTFRRMARTSVRCDRPGRVSHQREAVRLLLLARGAVRLLRGGTIRVSARECPQQLRHAIRVMGRFVN